MKVMIIDDSPLVLEVAREALVALGCNVVALDTPLGVPIIAGNEKPDLILVDVQMASMNGEQVVKGLKARARLPAGTRILLFSDRPSAELEEAASRCGADGFIRKTSDRGKLLAALEGELTAR